MAGYKEPGFEERVARAAAAKQKALDLLKARPPVDEAALAERRARREAADSEKAARRQAAKAEAEAAKAAKAREKEKAKPTPKPEPTEAERKAVRDARYAARKKRK